MLRSMLRRVGGRTEPVPASAGDLRIDPVGRRVWRGDTEVVLTARQLDVLEFLIRRAGQVVTKQEILNGVWQYDFDGDLNIIEVYIRRLGAAIDDPFGRRAIETIRGTTGSRVPRAAVMATLAPLGLIPTVPHRWPRYGSNVSVLRIR